MSNIKGISFKPIKKYLEKRYDDSEIKKLTDILGSDVSNTLMNSELNKSYPLEHYIKINKAIVKLFGNDSLDILKKNGRYSADEAVRGINKIFFKFGSPEFIMKQASNVFHKYYETGKLA